MTKMWQHHCMHIYIAIIADHVKSLISFYIAKMSKIQSDNLSDQTASVVFSLNLRKSSACDNSTELNSWKICLSWLSSLSMRFNSIKLSSDCSCCLSAASRANSCCHTIQCCLPRFSSFCCWDVALMHFIFSSAAWPASFRSEISDCNFS